MVVHELHTTEYDPMQTELEKELPYSICRKNTLSFAACFCKQPDSCQSLEILLRHAFEVLESPLPIVGCTTAVTDALVNSFKDKGTCPIQISSRCFVFTLPSDKIVPLETLDGFTISELKQYHVEIVCNSWAYKEEYEYYGDLRSCVKNQISNFQSVCIETEDGRPVAWETQHDYGGLGMLYVEPEYRRAKLGSVVTKTLARKLIEDDQLVFALVDDENESSFHFHKKNGYTLLPFNVSLASYNL